MTDTDLPARIAAAFPDAIMAAGGPPVTVTVPPAQWVAFAQFAMTTLGCRWFSFLSAVDWKDEGLEVIAFVEKGRRDVSIPDVAALSAFVQRSLSPAPMLQ